MAEKTAIMATVADTRCSHDFIARMHDAGMNGVRINSAHASPAAIADMVRTIRGVDPSIAILMDTKGAEIRTTSNLDDEEYILAPGDTVEIAENAAQPTTAERICISACGICGTGGTDTHILIDDGAIELVITENTTPIRATVVKGGTLGSRKTVTFRGLGTPDALPAVTERDRAAIHAGIEAGIDIIAHSFVRSADDVNAVRSLIAGTGIRLYSKIECRRAVENFDDILRASDGLLCARGDLGAEVGIERVPALENYIISRCRQAGKPVIVATQFMDSMMNCETPTRAEAGDIAWATMQGADTLLLCGETARGAHPVECVAWMKQIISTTEAYTTGGIPAILTESI